VAEVSEKRRQSNLKNRAKSLRALVEPGRVDDWETRSVCSRGDDTLFFHPEGERGATRRARAEEAKAICRSCPVMMECRAKALRTREPYGTWGGMSEDERAAVLAGTRVKKTAPRVNRKPTRPPLLMTGQEIPPGSMQRHVPAGPTVDHIRDLRDRGYTLADIARAAGMHPTGLGLVASGARESVTQRTAELVLSVHPESATGSEAAA